MSENLSNGTKKVFFMRHGRALMNTDYEKLDYNEFMEFMLKKKDPGLYREQHEIAIPMEIDVIYPSPSQRAKESAELIQRNLANHPHIDHSLGELIDEVKFSESIISENEFKKRKGLKGCRKLVLERWYNGKNVETFQQSISRLNQLRSYLMLSESNNILIITHAWFLRLVYLFYGNKEMTLKNLLSAPRVNYGEVLRESLLYPDRFCDGFDGYMIGGRENWNANSSEKFVKVGLEEDFHL